MKKSSFLTLSIIVSIALFLMGSKDNNQFSKENSEKPIDRIVKNPDIETVKNGILSDYSESLLLGNVLDDVKGCAKTKWESRTTKRGERLVKYTCEVEKSNIIPFCLKNFPDMVTKSELERIESSCQENAEIVSHYVKNAEIILIFALTVDGTSVSSINYDTKISFTDNREYITSKDKYVRDPFGLDNFLTNAYNDEAIDIQVNEYFYDNRK